MSKKGSYAGQRQVQFFGRGYRLTDVTEKLDGWPEHESVLLSIALSHSLYTPVVVVISEKRVSEEELESISLVPNQLPVSNSRPN
jgi:hypothetical protein